MKAFFGQHADPPSWRSNLLEQTIVLGTCETHSKVYPKLNQLRVFQVRTPPILVKYLAGTNYYPGQIRCWNELLALNFLGGRGRFLNPLPAEKRVRRVGKNMGFLLQIDCFELVTLAAGLLYVDF